MISFLVILTICIVLFILFGILVPWSVHVSMVKGEDLALIRKSNYSDFVKEFNKREWRFDKRFIGWFGKDEFPRKNQIHASIFMFDGVGMILDPISFFRFNLWKHSVSKTIKRVKTVKGGWE